jgi:hypothetical protein
VTTLTSPTSADQLRQRSAKPLRDVTALNGALFVLGALGAFIVAGNTPDGDASAAAVISHYADNRTQGIVASIILALAAIPTLAFGARLRERARIATRAGGTLPNFAFAAAVLTAAGLLGAATIHLALSDYARDLDPAAVQALNALDADSFLLFTTGIATIVLAGALIAIRGRLLPTWFGWVGILVAITMFTPVGFFAACVAGAWIIVASLVLSMTEEQAFAEGDRDRRTPRAGSAKPSGDAGRTPSAIGS